MLDLITSDPSQSLGRLAALHSYGILDTPREPEFDELVSLAATICGTPISVVNLIEDHRQWFKAEVGLGIRETPLDVSICRHVLLQPGLTIISDLRTDPRMCFNPLVTAESGLRFYAGCLLETPEGHGIGTLCILDTSPRELTEDQQTALQTLANQVMAQMELRRSLKQKNQLLEQKEMLLKEVNHRTKNNLQLILSLIQLQLRRVTDQEARSVLLDTSRRIMSVAAVHEKLYQADQVDAVDASAYLDSMIEGIKAAAPSAITFSTEMASILLTLDQAIPLALITNELVTNAIKYAYENEQSGIIQVLLHSEKRFIQLLVTDEGTGLPDGFLPNKTRSLGMTIISSLARQLKADVTFTNMNPGLQCVVSFPAS